MKVYQVFWRELDVEYVPPDPVVGGGYWADRYGFDLVTVNNSRTAKDVVQAARPRVKIQKIKCLTKKGMK